MARSKTPTERKREERARKKEERGEVVVTGDELEPRTIRRRIPPNPLGGAWQKETLALWHSVRDTQIAQRMIETDWRWLEMLLPLVDGYWLHIRAGEHKEAAQLLAKLRIELAELGFTPKARKALMWNFLPPGAQPARTVDGGEVSEGAAEAPAAAGNVVPIDKLTKLA